MNHVKFSIVTPSLNQRQYLGRTAESILSQAGDFGLEWLVVDGGSTDGTLDLLRDLTVRDPRVRWTSEADRGQSHAINKGLSAATGDIVAWLNSDDLYAPGALAAVADAFRDNPAVGWLVGRYEIIDESEQVIRPAVARYKERALRRYSYRKLLRENFVSQPAVFWRADFGRVVGPLDESLHWTMDYDLWLRMGRISDPFFLDRVLARFRLHPASKSGKFDRRQFDEQYAAARRYFGGDRMSRVVHRLNVEKIVWAYRVMRLLGW
jgi:glycosyltransferase involved in cell wall biosynthesis